MWAKVDDRLPYHAKIGAAGRLLGTKDGGALALAMATWGLTYAGDNLTDGFIPRSAVEGLLLFRDPIRVAEALAKAVVRPGGAGLWEERPGGWQIHDYHDHNRYADEVRAVRNKDRTRKEIERRKKLGLAPVSKACPDGQVADTPEQEKGVSEGCPDGRVAPESEIPPAVSELSRARVATRDPVPSRPVPSDHVPGVDGSTSPKEKAPPQTAGRSRDRPPDQATFAQVCAVVRSVLDEGDDWNYSGGEADLKRTVKDRLTDLNMTTDPETLSTALDASEKAGEKRRRRA